MCFSKSYEEKMKILEKLSIFSKEKVLAFNQEVFNKKRSDFIVLINEMIDCKEFIQDKEFLCEYKSFYELHFFNIMEILSSIMRYLVKYPKPVYSKIPETGFAPDFRYLIKSDDFNFFDFFDMLHLDEDDINDKILLGINCINDTMDFDINDIYRSELKKFFNKIKKEREYLEHRKLVKQNNSDKLNADEIINRKESTILRQAEDITNLLGKNESETGLRLQYQAKRKSNIMTLEYVRGLLEFRDSPHGHSSTQLMLQYTKKMRNGCLSTIQRWFHLNKERISVMYKTDKTLTLTQAFNILKIKDLEKLFKETPKDYKKVNSVI
jgi:hypothetical protein